MARRRVGPAQPPEWLWLVSIMLQVLIAAVLTAYTYFFIDDWLFIAEARRLPLSLSYLRKPLYEHFSPISRLLDKLLVGDTTGSFALAHDLQLVMYAAAIAAFAFVVRTILGNKWPAFFLTILFGQSLFLIRLLNWWTATANILPATVFSLIAFGAYLRWWRSRSFGWLIVCLACFLVALLDYENAMLLPLYILTVSLLVLADDSRPRRLNALRSEWRSGWASSCWMSARRSTTTPAITCRCRMQRWGRHFTTSRSRCSAVSSRRSLGSNIRSRLWAGSRW